MDKSVNPATKNVHPNCGFSTRFCCWVRSSRGWDGRTDRLKRTDKTRDVAA